MIRAYLRRLRWIHAAPGLILIALLAWGLASPLGSSPDDDFHLASTWCASVSPDANCGEGTEAYNREVPSALLHSACYLPDTEQSAGCQYSEVDFDPTVTELSERGNFVGGYPPVYYAVMGAFVGPDIQVSAVVMRVVSSLVFVALTTALFLLLPLRLRPTLVWGWLITSVPLTMYLIPSNNPSSWAIIGVGSAWIALLAYFESSGRRQLGLAIVFGLSTVIAAGARGDAAVYVAMGIVVVLFLAFTRTRRFLVLSILPLAFLVVCVVFFLTAQMVLSASNGFGGPAVAGPTGEAPNLLSLAALNLLHLPNLWSGVFGTWALGWFDVALPPIVAFGSLAVFVAAAFTGFGSLGRRKALGLAAIGLGLIVLPVYVLTRGGDMVGVEVQPRYLLPLIVMFAGLLMLRAGTRSIAFTRGQRILIVITLSVANFVALHTTMRRYVTGTDDQGLDLNAGLEWWWNTPLSPMLVLVIGSAAFAGAVTILVREVTRTSASPLLTSTVNP
jgi:hypothetical protein